MSEPKGRGRHSMRGEMTHPDTDVLAEFRAGLITGRRGAKITAHLACCERCTAVDDQLAGVSALLASVPASAMPDGVAQRLDTVLAAEVANRDHPERSRRDSPQETATPGRPPGHRGFRLVSLRVLAPAAAVVLAAGGYGLSQLSHGPGNTEAASAASAAASSSSAASAASSAGSAAKANGALAPVASPPRSASRKLSAASLPVIISHAGVSSLAALKQQVLGRAERAAWVASDAGRVLARDRLRAPRGRQRPAAPGREHSLSGPAGHRRRRAHRPQRHRLGSGSGLLSHQP